MKRGPSVACSTVFVVTAFLFCITLAAIPAGAGQNTATGAPPDRIINELLEAPAVTTGLPVRVATYLLRDTEPTRVRLFVTADVDCVGDATTAPAVGFAVRPAPVSAGGKPQQPPWLPAKTGTSVREGDRCRYSDAIAVDPGTYTLRIAAAAADGRSGSSEQPVNAQIERHEGYGVSDVVLLASDQLTAETPRPLFDASVRRDAIGVYVEVYGSPDYGTPPEVFVDIGRDASGSAVAMGNATVRARTPAPAWSGGATVSLRGLSAGDYVARVLVMAGGRPLARVTRAFHLEQAAAPPSPTPAVPAASGAAAKPAGVPLPAGPLGELLKRAADGMLAFAKALDVTAADERYTQERYRTDASVRMANTGGEPQPVVERSRNLQQRVELTSDLALVRPPETLATTNPWFEFRDVAFVADRALHDGRDRLGRLFLHPGTDTLKVANDMEADGLRWQLGPRPVTLNLPTIALMPLHPTNLPRFEFNKVAEKRVEGVQTWEVHFIERQHPSLFQNADGQDVPLEGTVWINPADGRAVRTYVRNGPANKFCESTVVLKADPKIGLWLPVEMREHCADPSGIEIDGLAKYANYRKLTAR